MKYQTYPAYKDSEIEWVDFLPDHWGKVKLRLQAELYAGGTPSKNIEEYWEDGTVPWINSGAVNQITVTEPSMYITEQAFRNSSAKWIPKNALVMALAGQGKTKGMVAKLAIKTTCNQSMAAIVPKKSSNSNYLFWWLTFNYQNIRNMAGGDLRDGLNLELLGNIECPTPTNEEKISIAQFLDHETAKIDTLIEKQQRLIELLKEKRQAVISHAVTKGLNPNAPMKESGVEWLGDVPEHWFVVPIKRICEVKDGTHETPQYVDKSELSFPLVTSKDFEGNFICFENAKYISKEDHLEIIKRSNTETGDILMSMIGGNIGKALIVGEDNNFSIKNVALFKTKQNDFLARYILFYLQSGLLDIQISLLSRGGAQGFLSLGDIRNLIFFKIPTAEIHEIVTYLNEHTIKFDELIGRANFAIELMQERRTALISAAVTGKIDVRDWGD
jgi:type I restriction enzyme S subunit